MNLVNGVALISHPFVAVNHVLKGIRRNKEKLPMQHARSISTACPNCSAIIAASARFCPHCGTSTAQQSPYTRGGYRYQPLQPGQQIRGYRVLGLLSKGGMGAVYVAEDSNAFDRHVVIKEMLAYFDPADVKAVRKAQDRFRAEAETLARLRHSGIPQIHTFFSEGPTNYIVMEYIEGQNLEERLAQTGGARTEDEVIAWGIALCRVLEYLAQCRPAPVIHHDIKPANVVLDKNTGEVRLVDFGTATANQLQHAAVGAPDTKQGSVYGTVGYAAPEMYRGFSEPRSDVYALAATLYHLVTGDNPSTHPFQFPHLTQLGRLGQALAPALEQDVTLRSTAVELRQQLETLVRHPILSPDGAHIHNPPELVAWCEAHWDNAARWLYEGRLPLQIEGIWHDQQLALRLKAAVDDNPSCWDAGLDAALAACDPYGFGSVPQELQVNPATLDFGIIGAQALKTRAIEIRNIGRRYVEASLQAPLWIGTPAVVQLAPGASLSCALTAGTENLRRGGNVQDTLRITANTLPLAQVLVQAHASRWRPLLSYFKLPALRPIAFPHLSGDTWMVALMLIWVLLIAIIVGTLVEPGRMSSGQRVFFIGFALGFAAEVAYIIQGARERLLWAVLNFFFPLAWIVFTVKHWQRAKVPFVALMSSIMLMAAGAIMETREPPQAVVSEHGAFAIVIPADWQRRTDLNAGADIQVSSGDSVFLVASAVPQEITAGLSLAEYEAVSVQAMSTSLIEYSMTDPVALEIEGSAAIQRTITGKIDGVYFTYVSMVIEGGGYRYHLIGWTETSDFERYEYRLRDVINSFNLTHSSNAIVSPLELA